jgi:hypothetical protein
VVLDVADGFEPLAGPVDCGMLDGEAGTYCLAGSACGLSGATGVEAAGQVEVELVVPPIEPAELAGEAPGVDAGVLGATALGADALGTAELGVLGVAEDAGAAGALEVMSIALALLCVALMVALWPTCRSPQVAGWPLFEILAVGLTVNVRVRPSCAAKWIDRACPSRPVSLPLMV